MDHSLSELLTHANLPSGQFHPWSHEIKTQQVLMVKCMGMPQVGAEGVIISDLAASVFWTVMDYHSDFLCPCFPFIFESILNQIF